MSDKVKHHPARYKLPQIRIRMVKEGRNLYAAQPFSSYEVAANALLDFTSDLDREEFIVVVLDTHLVPLNFSVLSVGGTDYTCVPISNIFKTAILANGTSVMLAHNHPSGEIMPSRQDLQTTKKAVSAGKLMEIPVVDHIICGHGEYLSLKEAYSYLFD